MVNIGKIVGTYGYRGNVKVESLSDFPERFLSLQKVTVLLQGKTDEYQIQDVARQNGLIIIKFKDIDSKEAAQKLKSAYLQVTEDEVYPLPDGCYYHFQLIGLKVWDTYNNYLGILKEVLETGANDVYVVEREDEKELLLPAIKDIIKEINLQENSMRVELLPGLE